MKPSDIRIIRRALPSSGRKLFEFFNRCQDKRPHLKAIKWLKLTVLGFLIALITAGCRKKEPDPEPTCYLYISPISIAETPEDVSEISETKQQEDCVNG